ncbi:MAG: hypothetical protein LBR86_03945 [Tannerella sp.]|nr:hypothetical protein [Tannerella sp.]
MNAKNSTVRTTSAHETCSEFIASIKQQYPPLHCVTYRKSGKWHIFRAQFKRRRFYSHGYTPEYAMARFSLEVLRKLFTEHYLSNAEYAARKAELRRRVIMNYAVYELPQKGVESSH